MNLNKTLSKNWLGLLVLALILGVATGYIPLGQYFAAAPPEVPEAAVLQLCGDDGKAETTLVARSLLNTSLHYIGGTIQFDATDGSGWVSTSATSSGTSLNTTSVITDLPCGVKGKVTLLATAYSNGVETGELFFDQNKKTFGLEGGEVSTTWSDLVYGYCRDSALANWTSSATKMASGTRCYNATLGTGGSVDFYFDFDVNVSASAFGSEKCGFAIVVDLKDPTSFAPTDVTLAAFSNAPAITRVNCASDPAMAKLSTVKDADVCFQAAGPIHAGGVARYIGRLTASLGDPADAADSPVFYIADCNAYRDTDSKIKWGYYDAGSTDVGETNSDITFTIN